MKGTANILAGVVLTLLPVALVLADHWDMQERQIRLSSLALTDWVFDAIVVTSSVAAACILPLILKSVILALYLAIVSDDLLAHGGPTAYFHTLTGPHGLDHDLFFGAFIWLAQTALMLIVGATLIGRKLLNSRSMSGT